MFALDVNLAKWKYARVHENEGGPIASISCRESVHFGERVFEAFADLNYERTGYQKNKRGIYGSSDGCGTAKIESHAVYAACSEALERWAWYHCYHDSKLFKQLAYALDSSTTGFAAYPGLFSYGARSRAYYEAIERWSLCAWWEGLLPHRLLNIGDLAGIEILSGLPNCSVVVLWAQEGDLQTYGFAAAKDVKSALAKAKIELARNLQVISYFEANRSEVSLRNITEKRLVHFSSLAGKKSFTDRLARGASNQVSYPVLVVDQRVPGKWDKYTTVWRCLFDNKGLACDEDKLDYFLF